MGRQFNSDIPLESMDPADRPPSYDDVVDTGAGSNPAEISIPGDHDVNWMGEHGATTISASFSESPSRLYRLIAQQAQLPPRQHVHIKGFKGKGQGSKDRETDFNFSLDLTPTLLRLDEGRSPEWHDLHVVRDGDGRKAYRGGIIESLDYEEPSSLKAYRETRDLEESGEEVEDQALLAADIDGWNEGSPSLMGWCERYCRDPAGVKSFTFKRSLEGFDSEPVRSELQSYIRSLNYRGHIEISTSIQDSFLTIYSPHWINRLRNNLFIHWFFILTQLWIFTVPLIVFLERRYKIVHSEWRSSRQVEDATAEPGPAKVYAHGRDEEKLADYWAAGVMQAAWDQKDDGGILTELDLPRLRRRGEERMRQTGWAVVPELNGVEDDSTQSSRPAPAISGVRTGGPHFQAAWGGNSGSTS